MFMVVAAYMSESVTPLCYRARNKEVAIREATRMRTERSLDAHCHYEGPEYGVTIYHFPYDDTFGEELRYEDQHKPGLGTHGEG